MRRHVWGSSYVCIGDFNEIASNEEKDGGVRRKEWSFRNFKNFIRDNELIDLGFKGTPWTWISQRENGMIIKERLDRAMASPTWIQSHQNSNLSHLHTDASDHCMLLLDTDFHGKRRYKRRFQFDQRWTEDSEAGEVIKKAWNKNLSGTISFKMSKKIKECRGALREWSKKLKGNAHKDIQILKGRLKQMQQDGMGDKNKEIHSLKAKLNEAYLREEKFWHQKARIKWLKEGDKNTAFFHACTAIRRKRNRIINLKNRYGQWCETEDQIKQEVEQYFRNLFTTSNPSGYDEILSGIPRSITESMNKNLTRSVDEAEIKKALFSMHPNKAPGPDGMSPLFFQKYWSIVSTDVVNFVKCFFQFSCLPKATNETLVTLILKIQNPIDLKHFRPISLCNVVYKIISKILANRMKAVLGHCISQAQSAFVPGRQIIDNIIIAHECIHFLNNKRYGRDGFMALKIDMAKAYDRVEWHFLTVMMHKMGFSPLWIRWVMKCVGSVSYTFNLNGEKHGYILPSRGIRQGDPLSPYLFLICSEGLSSLMKQALERREISGLKISRNGPPITHLLFADDSLLFCKAKEEEVTTIRSILHKYEKASGQQVNLEKSTAFMSRNTHALVKDQIMQSMKDIQLVKQGNYLGLPLVIGRSKKQVLSFIKEKVTNKIQGWKGKMLSQGGKEILLKSVAMAMPNYAMSLFKIPVGICKEIGSAMARFWWGGNNDERKIHWMSWKDLAVTKGRGGLGFRDIQMFNQALLAKQVWRIITKPNLFMSQVLKARYFPNTSLLKTRKASNASWLWKSLLEASSVFEDNTRTNIGDGKSINIWSDRWLPDAVSGKISTPKPQDCEIEKVHQLIQGNQWRYDLIATLFNQEDGKKIKSIPLSVFGGKDRWRWMHTKSGTYHGRRAGQEGNQCRQLQ